MRFSSFLFPTIAGICLLLPTIAQADTVIRSVTPERASTPCYEKYELTLDINADYKNPFDQEEVQVYALFTPPIGKPSRIDGFYYRGFTRKLEKGIESITPEGDPCWKIRFTPYIDGNWQYQVFVQDHAGSTSGKKISFTVTPSTHPGFIRRNAHDPSLFAYDNGNIFFPIGLNMCWGGIRGSFDYDDWLPALGKAGGNWVRIFLCSWNCALEWGKTDQGDWRDGAFHGVGIYSLKNAWKLDTILDTAERNGINVMLCLGTYGELTTGGFYNEGQWVDNPYNGANGGPCAKPEDFWTDPTAHKLYRQRLHYLVARYGYRTNIHSWEFWNEAKAPVAWVSEMASYLKGTGAFNVHAVDPYRHLITTTYGNNAVWILPEIDFTQTHSYGENAAPMIHTDAHMADRYQKPHMMSEFGIDWRSTDNKYDPDGLGTNLHNCIWSSVFSGNAGSGMIWYWDNYIHPKSLYHQFTALRAFTDTVSWADGPWKPLILDDPVVREGPEIYTDLILPINDRWGKSANTYTITQKGVPEGTLLPSFLYSTTKADLRTTPTFHVNYPRSGRFSIHVNAVSQSGKLHFLLDGKLAKEVILDATPPADPNIKPGYESTKFQTQWNNYLAQFNKDYGIDVPAGEHIVTLDNAGGDWISLSNISLTGYRSSRYPDIYLYGLTNNHIAILWAQNAAHNWRNVWGKKTIPVIRKSITKAHGLQDGVYTIEWWNTSDGTVMKREPAMCIKGILQITIPELQADLAARITKTKKH